MWKAQDITHENRAKVHVISDNEVHRANMGPTWDLSAPDGPHVGPMNLVVRDGLVVSHKPLPEPVLTQFDEAIGCHQGLIQC